MSYILDISTAVPVNSINKEELVKFYTHAVDSFENSPISQKFSYLNDKTKIETRYSCIPDFKGTEYELYTEGNYNPSIEKRLELYKEKIMPLAAQAIDKLFLQTGIKPFEITHLITVSCTGLFAPGFEFLVADFYDLQHTEKLALNFLGCYAALKALKHAHYIAQSNPEACILIVSAELCSLHFYPSINDEDIISNLLFADGAAAMIICGDENPHLENKTILRIDAIGSEFIPSTMDLMTWDISSSAFRMYLSKNIVIAIKKNITDVATGFLSGNILDVDFWAIHPGGVRIVQAVKESLQLRDHQVEDSMSILKEYGNMSSPTILFILSRILNNIKNADFKENKKIFSCAFGPGLNIEMVSLSAISTSGTINNICKTKNHMVHQFS